MHTAQPQQCHTCVVDLLYNAGLLTLAHVCPNTCYYVNGIIGIYPIVHGFPQTVYTVMEEEILNTRFELNVKGMTNFPGLVNIQGAITSVAGGTASEYSSMCSSLQHYIISPNS